MSESNTQTAPRIGHFRKRLAWVLLILLLPILGIIQFSGIRSFKVPSSSMEPTLFPSDYIVTRTVDSLNRGDIVVFKDPDYANEYLVKRIVGVGGDTISVFGGAVFLNNAYVSEPFRYRPIDYVMDPYEVPKDHFFLLGDNANRSIDSHNWGASGSQGDEDTKGTPRSISKEFIVGKVTRIYLPPSRAGKLDSYPIRILTAN
jgi:signal peptidase I